MRFRAVVLGLGLLCWPLFAGASPLLDRIAEDFRPLSGYLLMAKDGEYLIDVDADQGTVVGDLYSVITPGENIIHPKTKKVIGQLDKVKGVLKVTRLKSGYSHTRPMGKAYRLKRGDPVRRYQEIPATFWDYTKKGQPFFLKLRNQLPGLHWKEYAAAQAKRPPLPPEIQAAQPRLFFILTGRALEVRDSESQIIRTYPSPLADEMGVSTEPSPPEMPPAPGLQTAPPQAGKSPAPQTEARSAKPQEPGSASNAPSNAPAVRYQHFDILGAIPQLLHMAVFFPRPDGSQLLAGTDGEAIHLFEINEKPEPIQSFQPELPARILALSWWRPPGDALYLAVNFWNETEPESALYALKSGELTPVRQRLPYLMAGLDGDGDRVPETLLSQSFSRRRFWGEQVRVLRLENGELVGDAPAFKLPRDFTVIGSVRADLTGDGKPETAFVRDGVLYIYQGEAMLFKSPGMGGSMARLRYDLQPDAMASLSESVGFEIAPVPADSDGDGKKELLALAADKAMFQVPGISDSVRASQLIFLKYQQGTFVRGTLGESIETPVQGLSLTEDRLLFVGVQPGGLLGSDPGKSHLMAYPLSR